MINIIVTGAMGKMGAILSEKIRADGNMNLAAAVDPQGDGVNVLKSLDGFSGSADMIIDFSFHTAAEGIMSWARKNNTAVIMCTTGHTDTEAESIKAAAGQIPVFYSANMSLGIALLCELAKKTAAAFPDADIEIVETHHNRKQDAPSGTAIALGNAIKTVRENAVFDFGRSGMGKRQPEDIGFHAIRRGNIPGIHEVIVSTDNQAITLKHEVYDRALFADGALAAARFLYGKPKGLYQMSDIIA